MVTLFCWTFIGGRVHQEVTSITLVNNTAKTQDVTVGATKRWLLLGVHATNPDDQTRGITVKLYKEAAKTNLVADLLTANVGTLSWCQWPSVIASTGYKAAFQIEPLEAGNTISVTWAAGGASTGGTDADGLVVEYLEVDVG